MDESGLPCSDAMVGGSFGTFADCLRMLEIMTTLMIENGAVLLDEYDERFSEVKQLVRYFVCHNSKKDWIETWSIKPFTV